MLSHEFRRVLRAELRDSSIVEQPSALKPFETDGLTAIRQTPGIVVLPRTASDVRKVLLLCRRFQVPVVTRGAGTGLSGGARPLSDGLLLTLTRMNRILDVDLNACTATVEPGVTNLAISEAVSEHGLYYAPDPSSQIACSIGGNVAENSGGVHCLKYGLTLHNVCGLKVVTIDGEELTLNGKHYDSIGYDLLAVLIGSEGMLAVVTEVTVRLLPIPTAKRVLLASYESIQSAGNAVAAIIAHGIVPAGLEMMDQLAIQAAEEFAHAGYPLDAKAILLCELDGSETEVSEETAQVRSILESHQSLEIQEALTEEDRNRLWAGRKAAFPAAGRLAPDYYCVDGTIPRREIGRVLSEITRLSEEYGLAVANVFHAGDGNLHPLILYDSSVEGGIEKAEEIGGRILELCVAAGGTVTGEHGVGVEKLDQMCTQFNAAEIQQFHRLKKAFDPHGLMNPGKAIPTLTRCSELGGMHVHDGQLPYPDIERF